MCAACATFYMFVTIFLPADFLQYSSDSASKVQMNFECDAASWCWCCCWRSTVAAAACYSSFFISMNMSVCVRVCVCMPQLNSAFASIVLTVWNIFEYFVPINMRLCGLSVNAIRCMYFGVSIAGHNIQKNGIGMNKQCDWILNSTDIQLTS